MEWLWQTIVSLVVQHTAATIGTTLMVIATVAIATVTILNYRREGRWKKEEREKPASPPTPAQQPVVINNNVAPPAPPPLPPPDVEGKSDVPVVWNKMPPGAGKNFIAREDELKQIDDAWDGGQINVLSLIAAGGVGKTSVARKWLAIMSGRRWQGAEKVFCWSFYSQGFRDTTEATGDEFLDKALAFFGPDPKPEEISSMGKGQRLAALIAAGRNILVLDGLEPLQYPPGAMEGRIKDPGIAALIECLGMSNKGLCLITTRETPTGIAEFNGETADEIDLTRFKSDEGAALLKQLGVKGDDAELEAASDEVRGHGLALTLMGTYLRDRRGGDVRQRGEIKLLDAEEGEHAHHVIDAYVNWFGAGSTEVAALRLLGLFDRPAEPAAIRALRDAEPIPDLTAPLHDITEDDWQQALAHLRRAGLLAEPEGAEDDTLDAHPLIREYFAERLQEDAPDAWEAGNGVLFEHYKDIADEFPDTREGMVPLYAAVSHGCRAGRHQKALDDVLYARAERGDEHFAVNKLGLVGPHLAALSNFFEPSPPWAQPLAALFKPDRAYVLNEAGFGLRAQGRLREAEAPMAAGLAIRVDTDDRQNAAIAASNLSQIRLAIGNVAGAIEATQAAVRHADASDNAFWRMAARTALADAQAQAGAWNKARALFGEAETMQAESQRKYPILYSVQGYEYCELLLDGPEQAQDVHDRASQTLEWATKNGGLLNIALDHLSLGRAEAILGLPGAAGHLDDAVDGIRMAGQMDKIPLGLLARADFRRKNKDFPDAETDLAEALRLSERMGAKLREADAHLGFSRLRLDMGDKPAAREHLAKARALIEICGYHRRDKDLAELDAALG